MPCVLNVSGKKFDVDSFLREYTLSPALVWRVGEKRVFDICETNGFGVQISMAGPKQFQLQVEESTSFFQANATWLERLTIYPGIENMFLDFSKEISLDVTIPGVYFPFGLVKAASKFGFGLQASIYYANE